MKKKLILIAAMALSAMLYADINDTLNLTANFVTPATIVKIGTDPIMNLTYDSRNGGTDLPASVIFPTTAMELQANAGVPAAVSVSKVIALQSSANGNVSAEISLTGDTFTATETAGIIYYEGTMPAGGIENFDVGIECKNLATELPSTGLYTANVYVVGYLN